ncbi:MAG: hypothetical protein JO267_13895 [Alphaproteobacteria bacterium]|nr:hypothetical protein [Alphaproteobacteria bacterium]
MVQPNPLNCSIGHDPGAGSVRSGSPGPWLVLLATAFVMLAALLAASFSCRIAEAIARATGRTIEVEEAA